MTGLWEDTLSWYITEEAWRGALSAGAGVDGRQPGYFLRQQSRARSHLIDMYTAVASKRAQLFKLKHGEVENSQAAVTFPIYLSENYHLHTYQQLQITYN